MLYESDLVRLYVRSDGVDVQSSLGSVLASKAHQHLVKLVFMRQDFVEESDVDRRNVMRRLSQRRPES